MFVLCFRDVEVLVIFDASERMSAGIPP
jgi:hypothetical protein